MRRIVRAAAALPLLGAPALAQGVASDPTATGLAGMGSTASGGAAATTGPAPNAGQLEFSRTGGTGGAPSGTGAGISTGSASATQTDDTYLYPLYGKSLR